MIECGGSRRRPGRLVLKSLMAVLTPAAILLSALAPASAAALVPLVPVPGTQSVLFGDWCTSASNCWAVGEYNNVSGAVLNEILHWPGTEWAQVAVPQPGGINNGDNNELLGVTCVSASSCWAFGSYVTAGATVNETLRWNGTKWGLVATPQPGGTAPGATNFLDYASCTSAINCWAVGGYRNAAGAQLNEALRWNGKKWSLVPTPQPGGTASNLNQGNLIDVSCATASNCWAVGAYNIANQAVLNEALRWNGSTWSQVSTPQPGGTASTSFSVLGSVSCAKSGSCWAVGGYSAVSGATLNQALNWNGSTWSLVSTQQPDGTGAGSQNGLNGVTCTTSAACWAVGNFGTGMQPGLTQALRLAGGSWSLVATPDPGGVAPGDFNQLSGVACGSSASCWAVGAIQTGGGPQLNLALHWDGTTWSPG